MPVPSKDVIARLRVVQKQILESPEFYDQETYGRVRGCNTVCCIGGWLHYNEVGAKEHMRVFEELPLTFAQSIISGFARKLLASSEYRTNLLASSGLWIEPFATDYTNARTRLQKAKVAFARIDHFIETGE